MKDKGNIKRKSNIIKKIIFFTNHEIYVYMNEE